MPFASYAIGSGLLDASNRKALNWGLLKSSGTTGFGGSQLQTWTIRHGVFNLAVFGY